MGCWAWLKTQPEGLAFSVKTPRAYPAWGTDFWSQNTEGVARGVLTEKASPLGWVFSQAQHPMIKTYNCIVTQAEYDNAVCLEWSTPVDLKVFMQYIP